MTDLEFDYLKRAMAALEQGDHSIPDQIKMLRTISEITAIAAVKMGQEANDRIYELDCHGQEA